MRKSFKYRFYPNSQQAQCLESTLDRCRVLYDAALQERRDAWKMGRNNVSFNQQSAQLPIIKSECPEYQEINGQVLQNVLHRVDWAFQAFFHRAQLGGKPGYPRFKGKGHYDSITYPQTNMGWFLEEKTLRVSKIGIIKIRTLQICQFAPSASG